MCYNNNSTIEAICGRNKSNKPQPSYLADQMSLKKASATVGSSKTSVHQYQKGSSAPHHSAGHVGTSKSRSHQVRRSFPKLGANSWSCVSPSS